MDASSKNPEPLTDAELLQATFRYALALSHHRQDAEDLAQDAWVNLCRRYGGVTSKALLFTTVRNLFVDLCRRRKVVHFSSLEEADTPEWPEAPAEEPGIQGDLNVLLATLRPIEREVLFLHYVEGRTAEEISQTIGHPRGTILSLLHRTLAKLRKSAAEDAAPNPRNQRQLLSVFWM